MCVFHVDDQYNDILLFIAESKVDITRGTGKQPYFIMINNTRFTY